VTTRQKPLQIGIDIGGTFTDLAVFNEVDKTVSIEKSPTTPEDFSKGLFNVLDDAQVELERVARFVHGTTIATNAVIERHGAKVGLITTRGFRDTLEIMRIHRQYHYDLQWSKPRPLVPRHLRFGVAERMDYRGRVVTPLDEDDLRAIVEQMKQLGVEALAICFLFSFMNPSHELRAEQIVMESWEGIPISVSSRILPEIREYERTSTVVVDAYVKPLMRDYLQGLEMDLGQRGLAVPVTIMTAGGGILPVPQAAAVPVKSVHSGPAGGVIGTAYLGSALGEPHLLAIDAGGTSFEVSVVNDGEPAATTEGEVEWGIPFKVPLIDVKSIGAGGGSIARVDLGGLMQVGPDSAGAVPGPACYDQGGNEATLTDAFVVTGAIDPEYFLGGKIRLSRQSAEKAIERHVAEPMGIDVTAAALGIITVAQASMTGAMREMSTQRGYDPRDYALVAYGGAGPLMACDLARELSIARVVVPAFPGTFCAFGALCADVKFDFVRSHLRKLDEIDVATLSKLDRELQKEANEALDDIFFGANRFLQRTADLRYVGQNYEVNVGIPGDHFTEETVEMMVGAFNDEHRRRFGHRKTDEPIELVSLRATAFGTTNKPNFPSADRSGSAKPKGHRSLTTSAARTIEVDVYERRSLPSGWSRVGPLIIEEPDSTILIGSGDHCLVDDETSSLIIEVAESEVR
jgi:N-methylhydantoinase A